MNSFIKKIATSIVSGIAGVAVIFSLCPAQTEAAVKTNTADLSYVKQVFDAQYYYDKYPDVAAAFGNNYDLLLNHYIKYGINENRDASATFNAGTYKNNYKDLQKAFGSKMTAYCKHYVEYGLAEGRNAIDTLVVTSDQTVVAP